MGEPNDSTVLEFTCWCGAGAIYARSGISVDLENAFQRGCIVGAAIVAWGDAMRGMVRRAPVQHDRSSPPGTIDWEEHLEVYDCYASKYGRSQSAERLAERGGFGKLEAETLLGRPLRTWRRT